MKSQRQVLIADSVFTGLNDEASRLAVAIEDGRIQWVGSPDQLPDSWTRNADVRNFGAAFIMPGFHDAHMHFFHSALYASPLADRYVGKNEQDCVDHLALLAKRRPAGAWLLTQGWRDAVWDPPIPPTKHSLDAAYPDQPVAMYSGDAHTLWLNSCAMDHLGLDEHSVPPEGGSYDTDADGHLTGIVREAAAMALMPRIVGEFTHEELLDAYRGFQHYLNEKGVTAVCDVSLMALPGLDFVRDDLYEALRESDELTVRVSLFPTLLPDGGRLPALQERYSDPMLKAQGYKQFFDGVSSQHTAWLHDPYTNARFVDDCGRPTVEAVDMGAMVDSAAKNGHAVRIHAIGDESIHQALNIYGQTQVAHTIIGHNTLEHLENFQPEDITRLAALDVVASVQPRHITLDPGGPERDLGSQRVPYMWPFRTLLDAGATLAFGTDSPVTDPAPLPAVYTAVTRKDADTLLPEGGWLPKERITVAEALRAYTLGSAVAAGREQDLGTLEPGKWADIVVLDANPLECSFEESGPSKGLLAPEKLLDVAVLATFVGGIQVYGSA